MNEPLPDDQLDQIFVDANRAYLAAYPIADGMQPYEALQIEHDAYLAGLRAVAEEAAKIEREACCKAVCGHCEAGVEVRRDALGKWWHPQGAPIPAREGYEMTCSVLCLAQAVRARGESEAA